VIVEIHPGVQRGREQNAGTLENGKRLADSLPCLGDQRVLDFRETER
jgi:hypothetical protein